VEVAVWYAMLAAVGFLLLAELILFIKRLIETKVLLLKKEEIGKVRIKIKKTEGLYVLLAAFIVTMLIMAAEFFVRMPETTWLSYVGIFFILVGGLIMNFARAELGQYFTWQLIVFRKHTLVKTGVYSKIRHPYFLSIILMLAGIALFLNTLFGLVMVVIFFVPACMYAIGEEEEVLEEEFGRDYSDYREKTKKLIPFIY